MKTMIFCLFSVFLLASCSDGGGGTDTEICDNGRDDDGDSLTDCDDGDCAGALACTCSPDCAGKCCGDDGCGGSCADTCAATGQTCGADCLCEGTCTPLACADRGYGCGDWPAADGCGGDLACGACGQGFACDAEGQCQEVCVPDCAGKCCGDDGCGGSCADTCAATGQVCGADCLCEGACSPLACADRGYQCGDWPRADGCDGDLACGTCAQGFFCDEQGLCAAQCAPDCAGKCCGDDGCGGSCADTCAATGQVCGADCACEGTCTPEDCGDLGYGCGNWPGADGCGGDLACGSCGQGFSCDGQGLCQAVCQPQTCADLFLECGAWPAGDGCGGDLDCGSCGQGEACNAGGQCEALLPPTLVINELFYDQTGGDGPGAFIELWGQAQLSLDGFRLEALNGTDGSIYDSLNLDGAAVGADGYFLVAHPSSDADLLDLADLADSFADLQNGPDSLRLVGPAGVLDLVGYGSGQSPCEGAPAVDVAAGQALSRDAQHSDTDNNAADFSAQVPSPRGGDAPDCNQTGCSGLTYCDPISGNCLPGCDQDSQCDEYGHCDQASHTCVCDPNFHYCDGVCTTYTASDSCGEGCVDCPTDIHGITACTFNDTFGDYMCSLSCDSGYQQCGDVCAPCPMPFGVNTFGCDGQGACVIATCQDDYLLCDGACEECAEGWLDRDCSNDGFCQAFSCQAGYYLSDLDCTPYAPQIIKSAAAVQAVAVADEYYQQNPGEQAYGRTRLAYLYGPLQDPPTTQSVGFSWTDGSNWTEELVASDAYFPAGVAGTQLGLVADGDGDGRAQIFYLNPASQLVWASRAAGQWSSQVISGADQYSILDAMYDGSATIYLLVKNRTQGRVELFRHTGGAWTSEVLYTDGATAYGARGRIAIDYDGLPWIMLSTGSEQNPSGYVVDRFHPFYQEWTAACWTSTPFDAGLSFDIDRYNERCLMSMQEAGHIRLRRQTDGQADEISIHLTALDDWDAAQDQTRWNTLLVTGSDQGAHTFFNDYSNGYTTSRLRHANPIGDIFTVASDATTTFAARRSPFLMTHYLIRLVYVTDTAGGGQAVKFSSIDAIHY